MCLHHSFVVNVDINLGLTHERIPKPVRVPHLSIIIKDRTTVKAAATKSTERTKLKQQKPAETTTRMKIRRVSTTTVK